MDSTAGADDHEALLKEYQDLLQMLSGAGPEAPRVPEEIQVCAVEAPVSVAVRRQTITHSHTPNPHTHMHAGDHGQRQARQGPASSS